MGHRPLATERVAPIGGGERPGYPNDRPRKRNNNVYTPLDKARGLVAATLVGSVRAAQWLPIPQQTLSDWLRGRGITQEIKDMAKHFAKELSDKLENLAHLLADSIPSKIERAGLQATAVSLGIVTDKRQLLSGLPTAINETQGLSSEDRAARVNEIMARGKARADALRMGMDEPAEDQE